MTFYFWNFKTLNFKTHLYFPLAFVDPRTCTLLTTNRIIFAEKMDDKRSKKLKTNNGCVIFVHLETPL
jgi:hypothetical protein